MGLEFVGSNVIRIFPHAFHNIGKKKKGRNERKSFFFFFFQEVVIFFFNLTEVLLLFLFIYSVRIGWFFFF